MRSGGMSRVGYALTTLETGLDRISDMKILMIVQITGRVTIHNNLTYACDIMQCDRQEETRYRPTETL